MFHRTAHVYDLIYAAAGKDYAQEARGLHDLIQHRNPGARTLLDVACGTGGHLAHLRSDYDVTGIDSDPAMLEQARARLPGIQLTQADMRSFTLDRRFDAITCLFSSIGYLATTGELGTAITTMTRHLTPGGVLIVDGWVLPGEWRGTISTSIDTAAAGTLRVARVVHATREGRTTCLQMHHLIAHDSGVEYLIDHHRLTLFTRAEYQAAFHRAGLRTENTASPMPGRDRYIGQRAQPLPATQTS